MKIVYKIILLFYLFSVFVSLIKAKNFNFLNQFKEFGLFHNTKKSIYQNPRLEENMSVKKHTTQPIVTGTTVLGIRYNNGIMLASDTLASYGSLARYKDMRRLHKVGEKTIIGASGKYYIHFIFLLSFISKSNHIITFNYLTYFQYRRNERFSINNRYA